MTTDSDRISRLEGIAEQTTALLADIRADMHAGDAALRADIGSLRAEVKADISSLRAEVKADISSLRAEVKADIGSLRAEMQNLRAEMNSNMRAMLLAGLGIGATVIATIIPTYFM